MPGLILELILAVLVLAILGGAELVKSRATSVMPVNKTVVTQVVVTASPSASPPPSTTPVASPAPAYVFIMSDLRMMFAAPGSLPDLVAVPLMSSGQTAVQTVAFGSQRLIAAGCPAAEAPLGSLTIEMGTDGRVVANVNGVNVRYLEPVKKCPRGATFPTTSDLVPALSSLVDIP